MSRLLKTPAGTVDLDDPATAQPRLLAIIERLSGQLADARQQRQAHAQESGRHRRRADQLQARLDEIEQSDVAELRKELRAQKRIAERRTKRVQQVLAERKEIAARSHRATQRAAELTDKTNKYREQITALRVDLARARGLTPGRNAGAVLTDMQIATTLLDELRDRLAGEARRTSSKAASTALRIAAREVTRTRQQVAARAHTDEVAA